MNIFKNLIEFVSENNKNKEAIKSQQLYIEEQRSKIDNLRARIRILNRTNLKLATFEKDIKSKISDGKMFEIPFDIGTEIYWIIDDISSRNLENECITHRNGNDEGIVKLTIEQYRINKYGFSMQFKEMIAHGWNHFGIGCEEVGKTVFNDLEDAINVFSHK